jgi:hypothetical protein
VQIGDGRRRGEAVRGEELGLRLAAVAALTVPPAGAVGVQCRARRTLDLDVFAGYLQQGPCPLLVAPGCLALEDDLR